VIAHNKKHKSAFKNTSHSTIQIPSNHNKRREKTIILAYKGGKDNGTRTGGGSSFIAYKKELDEILGNLKGGVQLACRGRWIEICQFVADFILSTNLTYHD